jgi:hypothetical protein
MKRLMPQRLEDNRLEFYLANRIKVDDNGCWLWTGQLEATGYVSVCIEYKRQKAHRWFYEQLVSPIPGGLTLDHLCRVRHCVNPAHLEPVTIRENLMRSTSFVAINAKKTHCIRGHELTGENLIYNQITNKRNCRTCCREADKLRQRIYRANKLTEKVA